MNESVSKCVTLLLRIVADPNSHETLTRHLLRRLRELEMEVQATRERESGVRRERGGVDLRKTHSLFGRHSSIKNFRASAHTSSHPAATVLRPSALSFLSLSPQLSLSLSLSPSLPLSFSLSFSFSFSHSRANLLIFIRMQDHDAVFRSIS